MADDDPGQQRIKSCHCGRHIGGGLLPEGGRSLDVGEQQRHGSGRQLPAHVRVPIQRQIDALISVAHDTSVNRRTVENIRIYAQTPCGGRGTS